jgi:sodium/potassium-transporting ATPase subunit alpha
LAKLTNEQSRGASNLSIEITRFVRFIALLSLATGAIVFCAALAINPSQSILQLIVYGFITIIVANVPQGLPGMNTHTCTHQ